MKRNLLLFFIFMCGFSAFSEELSGKNLQAVNLALDAKVFVNDFEKLEEKLSYLRKVESEIKNLENEISNESKLICNSILYFETENAKTADLLKLSKNQRKAMEKELETPEKKAKIFEIYNDYVEFAENNTDLSSHFYFHKKEAQFATLAYLKTGEQLNVLKTILEDYQKIEEQNPKYSENLFMLGCILYFMPKIVGGDKVLAEEKLTKAITTATCTYEKSSALVMYSQILYEDKKTEEAKSFLKAARDLDPQNKTLIQIQQANEAGHSMFKMNSAVY